MDLVKCPFCGKEIENDSFYCDQCGEEMKLCPTHGFKKGKVCSDCGTKLVEAKNASTGQAQPVAAQVPPPTIQNSNLQSPPQSTFAGQPSQPASQPSPEATVRPGATAPAVPKYLVSNAINARLDLRNGAIIGRRAGDYIHVFGNQGYVSGTHARIQQNAAGTWEIVDLDSTNGTFLNGQKLFANQPATFKTGDTIAFYDLKFVVE